MRRVPDLLVEQLALGELDEVRAASVRRALREEEGGLERLAALEDSNAQILREHPTTELHAALRRQRTRQRTRWAAAGATLALAASALLFSPQLAETTRTKGLAPQLQVLRLEGEIAVELADGADATEGDQLQVRYVAANQSFGAVLSVDGRGTISQHLPTTGTQAVRLAGPGAVALPSSYVLDDAPDFERFYLLTSPRDFAIAEVAGALRAAEATMPVTGLPPDVSATSVTLRKRRN